MFAKTFIYSVFALVAANQAMGAAVPAENTKVGEAAILIATDACEFPPPPAQAPSTMEVFQLTRPPPDYACNCPNNCSYKEGSSCKFYGGPSDNSGIISGRKLITLPHSQT